MKDDRRVLFRPDVGPGVGLGHLRRCLTLAADLRSLGADCTFLLNGDATARGVVAASGFQVRGLDRHDDNAEAASYCRQARPAAVVVDSYGYSTEELAALAASGAAIVVLDDLAAHELPVDVVVNGGICAERKAYRGRPDTRYLLGPTYALLRPEFATPPSRAIREAVQRLLITVGGSDAHGLTARFLGWAAATLGSVAIDVVVGPLFEDRTAIERVGAALPEAVAVNLHDDPSDMRALMVVADLALCGGGQTTYELAAVGTPAVATRLAANQTDNLRGLDGAGALTWAGDVHDAGLETKVTRAIEALNHDPQARSAMSQRGRSVVDGLGSSRVARAIVDRIEAVA
jgi:UDP-2,4-diacetamido-2,4,6-trideoxy-beta-L-altropyranose hydrolase